MAGHWFFNDDKSVHVSNKKKTEPHSHTHTYSRDNNN